MQTADDQTSAVDLGTLTVNEGFMVYSLESEKSSYVGLTVGYAGDFNNDTFADSLVCGNLATGCFILFGGSSLENAMVYDIPAEQRGIYLLFSGLDMYVNVSKADYDYSPATFAGDFNYDGYDDVIVGYSYANDYTGNCYILFGGVGSGYIYLSSLTAQQGRIIHGQDEGDFLGLAVSYAGDVNGDGIDDVIFSGFQKVYLLYGGKPWSALDIYLSSLTTNQGILISSIYSGTFGVSISYAGDANGDTYDDILIGDPYDYNEAGACYFFYGGPDMENIQLNFTEFVEGFGVYGVTPGDRLGYSVSHAGDMNGDGYADVVLGAIGWQNESGAAYIVFGGPSFTNSSPTELSGVLISGAINDQLGSSVSFAGDWNHDGFSDIIVGAPYNRHYAGAAYVIFGGPDLGGSSIDTSEITSKQGIPILGGQEYDEAGIGVSYAGDVNRDGFSDVIIGAIGVNNFGGAAYLVYGNISSSNQAQTPFSHHSSVALATAGIIAIAIGAAAFVIIFVGAILFLYFNQRKPRAWWSESTEMSMWPITSAWNQSASDDFTHSGLMSSSEVREFEKEFGVTIHRYEWSNIEIHENSVLGKGSFGFVVKASLVHLSKESDYVNMNQMALKVITMPNRYKLLNADTSVDEAARKKFTRSVMEEVAIIAKAESQIIHKSSIVKVYGIAMGSLLEVHCQRLNVSPKTPILGVLMRFEGGGTLKHLLHKTEDTVKRFSRVSLVVKVAMVEKIRILKDIARALTELHSIGVVHGDLKPENVLLSSESPPEIRLADFGLSQLRDQTESVVESSLQLTARFRGTPIYAAPELFSDAFAEQPSAKLVQPSRKTDMYSFAILAWETLVQETPFSEIRNQVVLGSRLHQGYRPSLTSIPSDCPAGMTNMLLACWSGDRAVRLTAVQCYSILQRMYDICTSSSLYDVFISYHYGDRDFASLVFHRLVQLGFKVCLIPKTAESEHAVLEDSVTFCIQAAYAFLVCLSPAFQNSDSCKQELKFAKKLQPTRNILPILAFESKDWINDEMMYLCQILSQAQLFVTFDDIREDSLKFISPTPYDASQSAARITSVKNKLMLLASQIKGTLL